MVFYVLNTFPCGWKKNLMFKYLGNFLKIKQNTLYKIRNVSHFHLSKDASVFYLFNICISSEMEVKTSFIFTASFLRPYRNQLNHRKYVSFPATLFYFHLGTENTKTVVVWNLGPASYPFIQNIRMSTVNTRYW